jgi:signal transduction histidine kinase
MEVPDIVYGDGGRLRQVLTNLIGNAIKFTETGEVAMHCRMVAHEHQWVKLRLAVCDTGIGISQEDLDNKLFKPFMQVDDGSRRRYEVCCCYYYCGCCFVELLLLLLLLLLLCRALDLVFLFRPS